MIFSIPVCFFLLYINIRWLDAYVQYKSINEWGSTIGNVIENEVSYIKEDSDERVINNVYSHINYYQEDEKLETIIKFRYTYIVNDICFESKSVTFWDKSNLFGFNNYIIVNKLNSIESDNSLIVFFNKEKPSQSVIINEISKYNIFEICIDAILLILLLSISLIALYQ